MKNIHEKLVNGLNYLIPLQWWQIYNEINPTQSQQSNPQKQFQPCLKPIHLYINPFLCNFKEHILQQVKVKTKINEFDNIFINPQIKNNRKWKILNPQQAQQIYSTLEEPLKIITIYNKEKPQQYLTGQYVRIQLIFSSENKCDLFLGYFPSNLNIATIAQEVGKMLGFTNFINSRVIYSEMSLPQDLGIQYLRMLSAREGKQSPIQIRGLYHISENNYFQMQTDIKEYTRPVLMHYQTGEEVQNERRSISTKMNTPRIYEIQQNGQISRIKKIIQSNKHPQQIQDLRVKAQNSLNEHTIQIPIVQSEEDYIAILEELARTCLTQIVKKQ